MARKFPKMFEIMISVLEQIYFKLVSWPRPTGVRKALQHLFQSVLLVPEFDLSVVMFLRELLSDMLIAHKDLKFNGLSLQEAIIYDAQSLEEYRTEIVQKMGTEARGVMISLLPLVLRIQVQTVILDKSQVFLPISSDPLIGPGVVHRVIQRADGRLRLGA